MRIHAKKSLGQNFLVDNNIREKIVGALDLNASDILLEIGAGKGELTSMISERAGRIFALELDKRLYSFLGERFKEKENVVILNGDILKFDLADFLAIKKINRKIKVFGNIPYYISSPIIEHLLKYKDKISCIYLTVQKEFAQRMISLPGSKDYGAFSCFVQYTFKPRIIFNIGRNSFRPIPKVDSSFILLEVRSQTQVRVLSEERLFKIIRTAFNQRRKTLRNSLENVVSSEKLNKFFEINKINPNIRPEDLSLKEFAELSRL